MTEAPTDYTAVPHSREAEEALIGSVFIDPFLYFGLSEIVSPTDFYIHRNGWIWQAFGRLNEAKKDIDLITVADVLDGMGYLEEVGGAAYLTSLINQVPTSLNAETYANTVKGYSDKRGLLKFANRIAGLAYKDNSFSQAVTEIKQDFDAIENGVVVDDSFQPLKDVFSEVYDEAEERSKSPKEIWGIPTGLDQLDKETGGQQGGELSFWVGEPGVGKTWLLLGMALEMSKTSAGGFLSMELKKQSVARRVLSGASGVATKAIKTGFLEASDWVRINKAVEENAGLPLYLMYESITSSQLYHIVRQAKKKYNFGFLVVDYAMLFVDTARDDTERTAIISRNLKQIATTFDITVNCIHSVVKTGMDNGSDPSKSNMRGSGQQIHDADNVYFLTPYKQTSELDGFLREEQTKKMITVWCKKGRELENSDFHVHMVRKGASPFFAEYSRTAAQQERGF